MAKVLSPTAVRGQISEVEDAIVATSADKAPSGRSVHERVALLQAQLDALLNGGVTPAPPPPAPSGYPVWSTVPSIVFEAGAEDNWDLSLFASGAESFAFVSPQNVPAWLTINGPLLHADGTQTSADSITGAMLRATNQAGSSNSNVFTVLVTGSAPAPGPTPPPGSPTWSTVPTVDFVAGVEDNWDLSLFVAGETSLEIISPTALPAWLTFNGTLLHADGTQAVGGDVTGVVLRATNSNGATDSNAFPVVVRPNASTPPPPPAGSGTTILPHQLVGLPLVNVIVAYTGQVIEYVHVSALQGTLIVIPAGVHNVEIRYCEIGPSGGIGGYATPNELGIFVSDGAYDIRVHHCLFHDVASGLYSVGGNHPIIFEDNYGYSIRGPFPRGQLIQLNAVNGGSGQTRIRRNISDVLPGVRYGVEHRSYFGLGNYGVEDHINMYATSGISGTPVDISYNRLRGGHNVSETGSGMILGDSGGSWLHSHHNTLVNVRNCGIAIAGGEHNVIELNRVFMDGLAEYSRVGMYIDKYGDGGGVACALNSILNNRVWCQSQEWGQNPWWDSGACSSTTESGNAFGDATLNASIFMDGN